MTQDVFPMVQILAIVEPIWPMLQNVSRTLIGTYVLLVSNYLFTLMYKYMYIYLHVYSLSVVMSAYTVYMCTYNVSFILSLNIYYTCVIHVHDDLKWKERKNERQAPEANENELPQVGFEPMTLYTLNRCSYQLSYQGSPVTYILLIFYFESECNEMLYAEITCNLLIFTTHIHIHVC